MFNKNKPQKRSLLHLALVYSPLATVVLIQVRLQQPNLPFKMLPSNLRRGLASKISNAR